MKNLTPDLFGLTEGRVVKSLTPDLFVLTEGSFVKIFRTLFVEELEQFACGFAAKCANSENRLLCADVC